MLESKVESYLKKSISDRGALCYKLAILGKRNFPDRTILAPGGVIFFVELKVPNKDATKTQSWLHRNLRRLGFNIYVCKTKEDVDSVINKEMATKGLPKRVRKGRDF